MGVVVVDPNDDQRMRKRMYIDCFGSVLVPPTVSATAAPTAPPTTHRATMPVSTLQAVLGPPPAALQLIHSFITVGRNRENVHSPTSVFAS